MGDRIVSHKTAELAKEIGFNENVSYMFGMQNKPQLENFYDGTYALWGLTKAPTQSLLLRWLREVHKILVEVNYICVGENDVIQYKYVIFHHYKEGNHIKEISKKLYFNSYEEALESGLFEALKLVKNENN